MVKLDKALSRVKEIHGDVVCLIEKVDSVDVNIRRKLLFSDSQHGEWYTTFFNLIYNKNAHPARKKEKTRNTIKSRYGVDYAGQIPEAKDKRKSSCREKHGVDFYFQTGEFQEKARSTLLQKYGVETVMDSVELRGKQVRAVREKYGVDNVFSLPEFKSKNLDYWKTHGVENPSQLEEVKEKKRVTTKAHWGVEYPLLNPEIRQRADDTLLKKYGKTNFKAGVACVLENGFTLRDYLVSVNSTRRLTCAWGIYKRYGFQALVEYVEHNKNYKVSSLEEYTANLLGLTSFNKFLPFKRSPDFQLADNVYLDVDGLYWHSYPVKGPEEYHFKKRLEYEGAGLRLIQIRENEILNKPSIVKSMLNIIIGKAQRKIHARNCKVLDLSWEQTKEFVSKNHLQGPSAPTKLNFGLVYDTEMVMLCTFRCKGDVYELVRMSTQNNALVVGGFSKLLKHFMHKASPKTIQSWCDLRYAAGRSYEKIGFEKVRDVLGWSWTDFTEVYNRLKCRANMDARRLSNIEYAQELGWFKIYDAGQRLYQLTP